MVLSCRLFFALIGLAASVELVRAEPPAPGIGLAVIDFAYLDTSGEPTDQAAVHQQRLQAFMAALRQDFGADRQFRLVAVSCGAAPCTVEDQAPPDLVHAASAAGAKILVVGAVHKLSTLVQFAKVQAIDIDANRVVLDKMFTFRGDTDEAWQRAETFVSQEARAALVAQP
jgi:hypothetical protein